MDEITKTQRRTRGYWFSDGITEIVGGIALALVGLPMFLAVRTGIEMLSTMALMAMILLFPLSARVVRFLKDRITHPRTGYVKYPAPSMSRRVKSMIAAGAVAVAMVILALVWGDFSLDGVVGRALLWGTGAGVGIAFAIRGIQMRMPRFLLSAAIVLGGTVWLALKGFGFIEGLGLLWMILGGASILTGLFALIAYLRKYPSITAGAS